MATEQSSYAAKTRSGRKSASSRPPDPMGSEPSPALALAFLELAPDAIIVSDATGQILLVNHQTEVLFGYTRSELMGRPVEALLPGRLQTVHEQHRAHYLAAPHTRPMGTGLELCGQRKDGSELPVEVSLGTLQWGSDLVVMSIVRDVSARRRLERERQEQAEQLLIQAQLIDAAHDAVLVRDPSSRIISWNHGAEELYGWSAHEAVGQVSHVLFQTRFASGGMSMATVEAELDQHGRWEGEFEHTRSDGRVVQVESRQVLVRDAAGNSTAILEINRDITARNRLEAAERVATEQREVLLQTLQTVLGELPGGAYLVRGPEGALVMANRAARELWGANWAEGQPMAEFLRRSGLRFFSETGRPLTPEQLVTLQVVRGGAPVLQRREIVRRHDGTFVPILLSAVAVSSLLDAAQADPATAVSRPATLGTRAALVLLQDISVLQSAEQLKDEFISIAAHELRTPLTTILGFASMLEVQTRPGRGSDLPEWQHEAIAEIESAAARMNALITDLLDVTRIQADRLELHLVPVELTAMVSRCLTRVQMKAERHTLTLEVEAPSTSEPVVVEADEMRLEQVLENLLSNAVKYSPEGGPVAVTVRVDSKAAVAEVSIHDNGIGIPAEEQGQMFQRFARASNVHQHQIPGTGLGLFVCRELVERQGGHIWFESAEGVGTTFFLTFPLRTLQRDRPPAAEAEVMAGDRPLPPIE